jgi:hypothetical protein
MQRLSKAGCSLERLTLLCTIQACARQSPVAASNAIAAASWRGARLALECAAAMASEDGSAAQGRHACPKAGARPSSRRPHHRLLSERQGGHQEG